jgi:hypothetical protein
MLLSKTALRQNVCHHGTRYALRNDIAGKMLQNHEREQQRRAGSLARYDAAIGHDRSRRPCTVKFQLA